MASHEISPENPYTYKRVDVGGAEMAYIDAGEGTPIVFAHGNPTSSYLWRNVIPHLESLGRCLAPDLVGMGQSGKSPTGAYRFADHVACYGAWMDAALPTGQVMFVVHDWGAALSFDWAARHGDRVKGIAYMEAMVQPRKWSDLPAHVAEIFRGFRSDEGLAKAMDGNVFIEKMLPGGIIRELSDAEMAVYRAPYDSRDDRLPTIQWSREIPLDGEPADNHQRVQAYADWLAGSEVPKLFVNSSDGHALLGRNREFCRTWPNQREVTITGRHYLQEDSPHELGAALADWIKGL